MTFKQITTNLLQKSSAVLFHSTQQKITSSANDNNKQMDMALHVPMELFCGCQN